MESGTRAKWIRRSVWIFAGLIALGGALGWRLYSSPPSDWISLGIGQHRARVIEVIGTAHTDQRGAKGFELWNSEVASFMAARGRWQMLLTYDQSDQVSWKEIHFVPFESGGHNEWIPPQLLYRIKTASVRRSP